MLDSGVEWSNQKLKKALIDLRKWLKELRNYRKLEKQRRLPRLPCAVGDTVWRLRPENNERVIYALQVKEIRLGRYATGESVKYLLELIGRKGCAIAFYDDFGKTVFLTRQEAEEALERMKGAKA